MSVPQSAQPGCVVPLVRLNITEQLGMDCLAEAGVVFDRILSLRPSRVVVDLSGCRHIDAAALGLLLDVHRHLVRHGAVLTVWGPNPRIRRILQTARLDRVLPVATTAGGSGRGDTS